ncbi:MAG: sulfite exporter TauE/SafE family protein [Ignavibacteriaceae bacterium]
MNDIALLVLFLFSGYITGIFIGMLGIGGGIAFVPLLYLLLPFTDIDPSQISYIVIATSLFAGVFGTLSSAGKHLYSRNIEVRKAVLLGMGSIFSASVSPFLAVNIAQPVLQAVFGSIFLLVTIKMFMDNRGMNYGSLKDPLNDFYLFLFGLIIGAITGLAGIAGGILFVPILVYLFLVDFKKAIGTSALVTVFTTVTSSISYALISPKGFVVPNQIGYIYLISGIPLGLGSALGAISGVKFVLNSAAGTVKKVFLVLLLLVSLKIVFNL